MTAPEKKGSPASREFDDVYFSEEDGLAETAHVFLQGNNLPDGWRDRDRFVICEAGFGTGLNFLATWKLFEETSDPKQKLDVISIEKFPLSASEIAAYLSPWRQELDRFLDPMLDRYPPKFPGFHRLNLTDRVTLTLIFDDVNIALPEVNAQVDAWYLDGFMPSINPEMWSETLFEQMARLSRQGSRMATYTAAGHVRRALADVGFEVKRIAGFGPKRHMTAGEFKGNPS